MSVARNDRWKTAFRSLYYREAPEPDDPVLERGKLALLVIDVQNAYLARPDPASLDPAGRAAYAAWTPFHERMHATVIPTIRRLLDRFRNDGHEVLYARIACQTKDGRDRSLSQKLPGWNNLLLPKDELNRVWILRKILNMLSPVETMELLLDKLSKTRSNAEFLGSMNG